jgi:hypothetical protein
VKRYGQYGRKTNWIVKWLWKYGRKISWIVKRYGKYGRKTSQIFEMIWTLWKKPKLNSEKI